MAGWPHQLMGVSLSRLQEGVQDREPGALPFTHRTAPDTTEQADNTKLEKVLFSAISRSPPS